MKEQQTGNDLSIALRYDGVGAPRVTAKGEGDLAREILELAKKHGIPYQENPVLVQLLAQIELPGSRYFAKVCFGHPSPSKQQKLNATIYAYGAPTVLRSLRNHLFAALHNSLSDSTPT
ncbi:EscU/YscU/HrcU family type III secretion system export apparatus switch protein [Candidatus Reidiella endopervernicosa]|uniref:EscU/YscU/HrcU family type III secretion system export apparatus switch protein n=1 Tax=Candidatus Reidiella endopervernicosa TaxID=2738883 RepID=A0A6N0HY40_9GAMM|nr:EscU/YscU/HrcU family type III secretion system export apparatus switch protein [Candidatus Reidiella endopervernicosa]